MMAFAQQGENDFLAKLTEITGANLANDQFGVSELAREMGMSRSNLHRKVRSAHGTSVSQFINQLRLKKAMELLTGT
jgi:AraC-like DNA-binding protein